MKTIIFFILIISTAIASAQSYKQIYIGAGGSFHRPSVNISLFADDTTLASLHFYGGIEFTYGVKGDETPGDATEYTSADGPQSWWESQTFNNHNECLSLLLMMKTGYYHFGAIIGVRMGGESTYWYSSASHLWFHNSSDDVNKFFGEFGVRAGAGTSKVVFSFEYSFFRGIGAEIAFLL